MKLMQYTYNYEPEMYKMILKSNILNKKKNEHKIFKLLVEGYTCKEIGEKCHYSERTIQNRRRDIYKKVDKFILGRENTNKIPENGVTYYVYKHTFPNGKVYIGMTEDIVARWCNGKGYKENEEMFEDILKYGWGNIKHEIIDENLTYREAQILERTLIQETKSYISKYGYNKMV